MNQYFVALSKVARGEILSVNPNTTSARKMNPNWGMTMKGALRDVCHWTQLYQDKRSLESDARAAINGRVKLYFKGPLVNDFEDEELNRIILEGCRGFVNIEVTSIQEIQGDPQAEQFLIKMYPTILNYLNAKLRLFIKHIITPNFSSHELRLKFSENAMRVDIEGYIWPRQFIQVNRQFAASPQVRCQTISDILMQREVLPTATLDWNQLSTDYKIDELRAREIIRVARTCQLQEAAAPLSLLDIWTPGREQLIRFGELLTRFTSFINHFLQMHACRLRGS